MSQVSNTGRVPAGGNSDTGKTRTSQSSVKGLVRLLVAIVAAFFLFTGIGYFVFLDQVQDLTASRVADSAQGIIVLTGGYNRLESAAALMNEGKAERLLVSGVNTDLGREDLRHAMTLDDGLFDCCVDIDYVALDTAGNAAEGGDWAQRNGYTSVIVVTNDYHMPRSLAEMRRVMGDVELIPHAVVTPAVPGESIARKLDRHRVLSGEYVKYMLTMASGLVSGGTAQAGHSSSASMQTGW